MKKFFEEAEIEIVKFDVADVITASPEVEEPTLPPEPSDPYEVPGDEF